MKKSIVLEICLIVGLLILNSLIYSCVTTQTPASQYLSNYVFKNVKVHFPSNGWQFINKTETRVGFIKRYEVGLANNLSFWSVDYYDLAKGFSREQHIKRYFEMERTQPRNEDTRWFDFKEGTREINNVIYPIMTFRLANFDQSSNMTNMSEGVFLLIFPDDFQTLGYFYCFMWLQIHRPGEPVPPDAEDFDKIIGHLEFLK